jgi:hypothetical protein
MFKRFFTLAYAEIPTDLLVFITHFVPQIWLRNQLKRVSVRFFGL